MAVILLSRMSGVLAENTLELSRTDQQWSYSFEI